MYSKFTKTSWIIFYNYDIDDDNCNPNPCKHGGLCHDEPFGHRCDCTLTNYYGNTCELGKCTHSSLDNS